MKINKNLIVFFAALIAFTPLTAQDDDPDNLVPNASFEEFEGNLRRDKQFDLTKMWRNATDEISELYATGIRSKYVAVPDNSFGSEEPADGDNYAGITMYSYRGKVARSYISVQLKSKMRQNELYCVRYKASLAERSRYASNNLGALLTQKRVNQKGTGIITDGNAIVTDGNPIVSKSNGWWDFCKRYVAKGNEQFLTIGNFESDAKTQTETKEVSSEFERGPVIAAYYYIDDVEIRKIEPHENCGCEGTKIPESKVIYSGTFQFTDEMSVTDKVNIIEAYFYQYSAEVVQAEKKNIDLIVELMKESPGMKIQVIAHTDDEEEELAKSESVLETLAEDRAKNVREYIASQGIDRTRILMDNKKNKEPSSTMSTPISLAKNRRVQFKIVF